MYFHLVMASQKYIFHIVPFLWLEDIPGQTELVLGGLEDILVRQCPSIWTGLWVRVLLDTTCSSGNREVQTVSYIYISVILADAL